MNNHKQQQYKKRKQTRCFNIINMEIGCTSEGSIVNQSWKGQFPVATFSQMARFGSWTT